MDASQAALLNEVEVIPLKWEGEKRELWLKDEEEG